MVWDAKNISAFLNETSYIAPVSGSSENTLREQKVALLVHEELAGVPATRDVQEYWSGSSCVFMVTETGTSLQRVAHRARPSTGARLAQQQLHRQNAPKTRAPKTLFRVSSTMLPAQ